jgi:aminoglycoside phosphotransferase (APT) family kinase protein
MMPNDTRDLLQAYYSTAFPDQPGGQVVNMEALSQGWESEMYSFEVSGGSALERHHERLVLRIYPGNDAYEKSQREFHAMSTLHQVGYPVPRVLLLERDNSPFGRPFLLMEWVEGRELWSLLFGSRGKKQQRLLHLFCDLLVRLHALDGSTFVNDGDSDRYAGPYACVDGWLEQAHQAVALFPEFDFTPIAAWLEVRRNTVPCSRPAPTHGDYHAGNLLLRDDGSAVVVDWTGFQVSDPRFDLAWTLVLIDSYQGGQWRQRILREYERLAGSEVTQLGFFLVAACASRLFSVVASLAGGAETMGMRPGAEAMMRRQLGPLQRVYNLMQEKTGVRLPGIERAIAGE